MGASSGGNRNGPSAVERIDRIIHDLDGEQREWIGLISRLDKKDLAARIYGAWTAVDTLAHVTAWKENALKIARLQAEPDSPDPGPTRGPAGVLHINVDEFNKSVLNDHRDWGTQRTLEWSARVHRDLIQALEDLGPDRVLNGRGRHGARQWYWMPASQHSSGHRRALEKLLAGRSDSPATHPR